ncbi:MAG: HEAT repeat domain-containing protein [Acidobacteria bacterium]|nr:HEAT repeat domain-containing protein [Acidobacteriota bacterium]
MGHEPPADEDLQTDPDIPEGIYYDPDLAVHEPARVPEHPLEPSRRRSPLLLFVGGILGLTLGVYVLFGLIADEDKTSSDYLDEIGMRSGSAWQVAFELSRMIGREDPARRDPSFIPRLLNLFERSIDADPRLRRYLTLTLRELRDPSSVEALLSALDDDDLQTRLYAVEALGAIADPRALATLLPLVGAPEPDLRKVTAHALGSMDGTETRSALRGVLNDPIIDVAWNAALSLARIGDPEGAPLLARMLDRDYLRGVTRADEEGVPRRMTERQIRQAMINALHGLVRLEDRSRLETIRMVAGSDPDLHVRQAALQALDALSPPRP